MTFVSYIFIVTNIANLCHEFFDNSTQLESVQRIRRDLYDDPPHNLKENGITLGLTSG